MKNDLCGQQCPIWAEVKRFHYSKQDPMNNADLDELAGKSNITFEINGFDWTQEVTVSFHFNGHCYWFHALSILSCFFGVTWLILFSICGKGGYYYRM